MIASRPKTCKKTREKTQGLPRFHGRILRAVLCALFVATVFAVGAPKASAEESKIPFLIEKLKADDYRVRTNAALALGASKDDAALQPLCGALADDNEVVRQAATAGLKRLRKASSLGCLKSRAKTEQSEAVKLQLTRAIEAIEAEGDSTSTETKLNASAKYYVAISSVQNRSDKAQKEVDAAVLTAVKKKLDSAGSFQIAPDKEAAATAKAEMKKRSMKGFYLAISVDPFDYASGTKASVRVAIFTYPGKDLRGEVPGRARSSAQKGDKDAEAQLLTAATETAIDAFVKNAGDL
jgi:hypothetical protein